MRKKLSLFLLALITGAGTLFASNTKVGGIWYDFNSSTQTASVTCRGDLASSYSNEYSGSVVIPSSVTYNNVEYSVTSIRGAAFYDCTSLTSVTIPNSVTSIGNKAFYGCTGLTSVTIGNSVTCIGEYAFRGCSGLTSIEIPNSVTSIGSYAFNGCSGLTSVAINSNEIVSKESFIGDIFGSQVTEYIIGEEVTSIGYAAFYGCSGLTSIEIPNSVTSIGSSAFYDCSSLTSVTIGNSVTSIGNSAFYGCYGLTSSVYNAHVFVYMPKSYSGAYTIPDGIASIAEYAFSGCSGLTSVTIPNSVTSIGSSAFENCSSLTSIDFPASLEYFDEGVINGCTGLVSIKIPSSVLSSGEYYGAECVNNGWNDCDESYMYRTTIAGNVRRNSDSGLPYIHEGYRNNLPNLKIVEAPVWFFDVPEDSWAFCPKSLEKVIVNRGELNDNVFGVISRSYKTLKSLNVEAVSNTTLTDEAFKDNYNLTELILPANLTSVSYMAVAGCKNLKAITIPASVEVIEASAFEDCRSIQSITFGGAAGAPGRAAAPAASSQLKKIGNWAFYNAHELQHLDIPEGVEEIGDGAFYGCTYLEDMVLPSSIRSIGDNCFALCGKLAKIICNATTPPAIQAKTFYDVNRLIPVYVPDESVASYESDEYWQEFDIQGASDLEDAVNYTTDNPAAAVTKVMRDGQVLIMRGGKMYNLQGVEVR